MWIIFSIQYARNTSLSKISMGLAVWIILNTSSHQDLTLMFLPFPQKQCDESSTVLDDTKVPVHAEHLPPRPQICTKATKGKERSNSPWDTDLPLRMRLVVTAEVRARQPRKRRILIIVCDRKCGLVVGGEEYFMFVWSVMFVRLLALFYLSNFRKRALKNEGNNKMFVFHTSFCL